MEEQFHKVRPGPYCNTGSGAYRNSDPEGGETAELFRKVYSQDVELPCGIGRRVTVVSCVAYSEKQQVYLVKDKREKLLILKLAQGEKVGFLRRDATVLKEKLFPFLPRYLYYAEYGEKGYLLREYIKGDTLWEWVNKHGPFRYGEANEIMCRLCGMVGQFHRQEPPIIHRDIKPQNIVRTAEKKLFMIDMGTARKYKESSSQDTVLIGSRPTAAPEQYGYRQTDARSDIYALGVLYLFLITGSLNVQGLKYREAVPGAIRKIIEKCTKMDPDDRYQSCGELKRAIAALRCRPVPRKKKRRAGGMPGAILVRTTASARKVYAVYRQQTKRERKWNKMFIK